MLERPVRHAVLVERRTGLGGAEALERQAAVHGAGPVVVGVLVDAPADAGLLEHVRHGRPGERRTRIGVAGLRQRARDPAAQVVGLGVGVGAVDALGRQLRVEVGAGPEHDAIRIGAGRDRAVIGVADRERLGQRELERDVVAAVVAHRVGRLVLRPEAQLALVPGRLRVGERVRRRRQQQRVRLLLVQMERRDLAGAVGLEPGRLAALQRDREAVAETAHAAQGAEVVVEAAVLLHQDHDVLDVLDRPGLHLGRDGQRLEDARRKHTERRRRAGGLGATAQEVTPARRFIHHVSWGSVRSEVVGISTSLLEPGFPRQPER